MINLRNDYCGIAHPKVLEALNKCQLEKNIGYGLDEHTKHAEELIKKEINNSNVDVHFLPGGTVSNKVCIGHILKPYQAVITADSGHINVHETGAIEETGHKVLTVNNINGKISPSDILKVCSNHTDEHMVMPKMVYITFPTEYGTLYKLDELRQISEVCKQLGLYLYLDGARLACGLTAKENDITLQDIAKYTDIFYIGGTKNGLMFGEAVVVVNEELKKDFRYSIKHFGGMMSKGFINGIMFEELFKNNLLYEIGKKQNQLAYLLTEELQKIGITFLQVTESNQVFPIFDTAIINELKHHLSFEIWENKQEKTVIRFVTHYLLNEEDIKMVIEVIKKFI